MYPPGKSSGETGSCGGAANSNDWAELPLTCPAGCTLHGCASDYESTAERFNECMTQVSRHLKCARHVDCEGTMFSHYTRLGGEPDPFAAQFTGAYARCPFIDRDVFLADCEARTAYADQRESSGGIVMGMTFGLPALVFVMVAMRMVLHTPRVLLSAWELECSGEAAAEVGVSMQEKLERVEANVDSAGMVAEAMAGAQVAQAKMAAAIKDKSAKVLRKVKGGNSDSEGGVMSGPWAALGMAIGNEALELVSQFSAFSAPSGRYITEPLIHGGLIAMSGFATPFFIVFDCPQALTLFNGFLVVGYAFLASRAVFNLYLEQADGTGVVSYTAISATQLFLTCQSAALPLLSFAVQLHGKWLRLLRAAAKRAAHGKDTAADQRVAWRVAIPEVVVRKAAYRRVLLGYALMSWAVGIASVAALAGWNCAVFRTCARPPCDVGTLPLLGTPVGQLTSSNTFSTSPAAFSFQTRMMAGTAGGAQLGQGEINEWNLENLVNLVQSVAIARGDSGDVEVTLTFAEQNQPVHRQISSSTLSNTTLANLFNAGTLGTCETTFLVQCQEKRPGLAFIDTADPLEFVEFYGDDDQVFKLVVKEPAPACWEGSTTDPSGAWWHDLSLFGPSVRVGTDDSGAPKLGIVMKNGVCCSGASCSTEVPCLQLLLDVAFAPGYGRKPLTQTTWALSGGASGTTIPTEWNAVTFGLNITTDSAAITNWQSGGTGGSTPPSGGSGGTPPSGGSGGTPPSGGSGSTSGSGGSGGTPPPGGSTGPQCLGGSSCDGLTPEGTCTAATGVGGAACTWGDPGVGGGAHCAGPSGCETNTDSSSCTAAAGCNWNTGSG